MVKYLKIMPGYMINTDIIKTMRAEISNESDFIIEIWTAFGKGAKQYRLIGIDVIEELKIEEVFNSIESEMCTSNDVFNIYEFIRNRFKYVDVMR